MEGRKWVYLQYGFWMIMGSFPTSMVFWEKAVAAVAFWGSMSNLWAEDHLVGGQPRLVHDGIPGRMMAFTVTLRPTKWTMTEVFIYIRAPLAIADMF